jgi:hypothetical protein
MWLYSSRSRTLLCLPRLQVSCMRTTLILCLAGGPHSLREAAVALLPPIPCVQLLVRILGF